MPERIETAQISRVEPDTLEINDAYPGTYGFLVRLSRQPGPEWGVEFETAYEAGAYPGKPPVFFEGDFLRVFYLPRYADALPTFFRFLSRVVAETNKAVDQRNSALPDEENQKAAFRSALHEAGKNIGSR